MLEPALAGKELRLQRVDLALIVIALRLHHVADRHHADQPVLVHDWQVTNAPLGHRVRHRQEIVVGLPGDDITRHEVGDGEDEELVVPRRFPHDVALGQDADRALALHGAERADVVAFTEPERLPDRLLRAARHGHRALARENVRDVHQTPPCVLRAVRSRNSRAHACGATSRRATRSSSAAPSAPRASRSSTVSAIRSWAIFSTRAVTIRRRRRSSSPLVFRWAMWLSRASAIGSMPSSRAATADRTGGIQTSSAAGSSVSIARISATVRSAPSRSALLTTCTSAISRTPALSAWTSSPRPGTETTITVWARRITSTSSCPTPTVSTRTRLRPAASMRSTASAAARLRPPRAPRVAIERMKIPGSRARSFMRIRSPRIAPPENGEEGSTATTPTVRPRARAISASARARVLLPLPGAPVSPTICARPVFGSSRAQSAPARARPDSIHVSPRASARVEPSTICVASASTSDITGAEGSSSGTRRGREMIEEDENTRATCSIAIFYGTGRIPHVLRASC